MNTHKKLLATSMSALVLSLSIALTPAHSVAVPQGAKELFVSQLNAAGLPSNLGLSYSIELQRDGKLYKVDSRYPFRSGDKIRFHVKSNIDGYMYVVLDSEAGGNPMLMFPRPGDDENSVQKGKTVTIPAKGTLNFDEAPGLEALKLVLSQKKLEQRPEQMGRSVVIREKANSNLPAHFLIDFAALDHTVAEPTASATEFVDGSAASTMVSMQADKPLVVDLLLRHYGRDGAPAITVASAAHDGSMGIRSTPGPHNAQAAVQEALTGSSPVADKWAVVVGISKFKNPKWNLNYPDKDAKDFADYLIQKAHFAPDHVRVLTDSQATRERILTDIGSFWLPFNAKPNDLVCIYFATHGTSPALDVAQRNFLMAYDTDPVNPFATGIELNDLARNVVRRLRSQRVVLILDTCHSGAAEAGAKALGTQRFDLKDLLQGTGHVVISSAGASQIAHDSRRYKNGIFTRHLIDGLSKYERLTDVFKYTRAKVQEESVADYKDAQIPVLKDAEWKGEELRISVPPVAPRKPVSDAE
jgi:hypothetical protein